jgi:hypothetical protein
MKSNSIICRGVQTGKQESISQSVSISLEKEWLKQLWQCFPDYGLYWTNAGKCLTSSSSLSPKTARDILPKKNIALPVIPYLLRLWV